jgi:dolichyl-phosphate beta-glucosyltransferase
MKPQMISIIVPAYNESARIDRCISSWVTYLRGRTYRSELILVDNGSTDDTGDKISLASRAYAPDIPKPYIRHFRLDQRGKGLAVRYGMLKATGDYRYMADVDLASPPGVLSHMLVEMLTKNWDIVIGQRVIYKDTFTRQITSRVFHAITSMVLPDIPDTQCGFKLFTRKAAEEIFERCRVNGMAFDVEALYIASRLGFLVYPMVIPWKNGKFSRVKPSDIPRMAMDVYRIRKEVIL